MVVELVGVQQVITPETRTTVGHFLKNTQKNIIFISAKPTVLYIIGSEKNLMFQAQQSKSGKE